MRVIDKDGGLLGGSNLGDLDLGLVDDYVSTPLTPEAQFTRSWRLVPGGRCLALKTASYEDSVRYLPLTSATGGHGSAAASVPKLLALRPIGRWVPPISGVVLICTGMLTLLARWS